MNIYIHMCVFIYIYIYEYIDTHTYIYTNMCIHIFIYTYICTFLPLAFYGAHASLCTSVLNMYVHIV